MPIAGSELWCSCCADAPSIRLYKGSVSVVDLFGMKWTKSGHFWCSVCDTRPGSLIWPFLA